MLTVKGSTASIKATPKLLLIATPVEPLIGLTSCTTGAALSKVGPVAKLHTYSFTNELPAKSLTWVAIVAVYVKLDVRLLAGVNIHLSSALSKVSNKNNPDYRNSIKESISAIETIAKIISGDDKADLSKALSKLKDKIELHPALEQGFKKIYAYASDEDGIRHSIMEEKNLDKEDAIYMLVSCSAFVNYLIVKADKAGILKN